MTDAKEAAALANRFCELAERSLRVGRFFFTDFLGLAEQDILHAIETKFPHGTVVSLSGGAEGCERQAARFGDPEQIGYDEPFPIAILKIEPKNQKFADALTHRDFLGALMNLGVAREKLGDIVIRENCGYLFCAETIAPFLAEELRRVKRTDVLCAQADAVPPGELFCTKRVTVQAVSERIDALVAKVFSLSREEALGLFRRGLVFRNGREAKNNSALPSEGDVISVRGYGRMIYRGCASLSKKGKKNLLLDLYV